MIKTTRKYRDLLAPIKAIKKENRTEEQQKIFTIYSEMVSDLESIAREEKTEREALFKSLYGGHTWTKVKKTFISDFRKCKNHDEVSDVYNKYIPYIWYTRTLNTAIGKYTDFRNVIRELDTRQSNHALETIFSIGDSDKAKGIFAYKEQTTKTKVIDKIENSSEDLNPKDVEKLVNNLRDYIDNFEARRKEGKIKVYSSANPDIVKAYYVSFLLGLVTGRRQVEILKTLEISSKRGVVTYKGLSKLPKNDNGSPKTGKIIFMSIKDAQKYLRLLRKLLPTDNMTTVEVNKKYNGMFNKAFKDRLVNDDLNIISETKTSKKTLFSADGAKFHNLRACFAETTYKLALEDIEEVSKIKEELINEGVTFDDNEEVTKSRVFKSYFISVVLHQQWKLNASDHYDGRF